jgi:hypothetical protein
VSNLSHLKFDSGWGLVIDFGPEFEQTVASMLELELESEEVESR